jgi:hypothetical protein
VYPRAGPCSGAAPLRGNFFHLISRLIPACRDRGSWKFAPPLYDKLSNKIISVKSLHKKLYATQDFRSTKIHRVIRVAMAALIKMLSINGLDILLLDVPHKDLQIFDGGETKYFFRTTPIEALFSTSRRSVSRPTVFSVNPTPAGQACGEAPFCVFYGPRKRCQRS